jgi:basic amino acid/polyamine antiporter, APA family
VTDGPPGSAGGRKPKPKLGLWMAIALVMGSMIGSGVFLLPASLAPYGWNAVIAWGITICGAMLIAATFSALVKAGSGSEGPIGLIMDRLGPMVAALIGWSAWVSYWAASATVAIAAISYLSVFAPAIASPGAAALAACGLIGLLTIVNLAGARAGGWVQLLTTIIKVLPLIAIALVLIGKGGAGDLPVEPLVPAEIGFTAITAAAALTLWALVGFESAGLMVDKIERPEINVPRSTLIGTALTGLIYVIVCSGIVLTLPAGQLAQSDAPFALFLETYVSREAAYAVAGLAAISAIGALNGFVLVSGEVPLTMAKAGLLPQWFGETDTHGTPRRMLLISSVLAIMLVAANASKTTASLFTFMALLSTSAVLWLYLAMTIVAIRLRTALVFAVPGAAYALWTLWGAGVEATGLSLVLMISVVPIYLFNTRRNFAVS